MRPVTLFMPSEGAIGETEIKGSRLFKRLVWVDLAFVLEAWPCTWLNTKAFDVV